MRSAKSAGNVFGHGLNEHGQTRIVPCESINTRTGWPKSCGEHREAEMTFTAYLPTSGASFGPDAVASMAKAFEDAVSVIGIGPREETKREAVARFILHLAEIDGGLDSVALRDKAVMALGGSIHVVIRNDRQPNAGRP